MPVSDAPDRTPPPRCVAIVGVGLIGGPVAMAVTRRMPDTPVIGLGRSQQSLDKAVGAGVLNAGCTTPQRLVELAADFGGAVDLVVVCTPVDRIPKDLRTVASVLKDAVLTDAGSTKGSLARAAETLPRPSQYVPAHPMAGSEKTGWRHARADLFEGRVCVVTPTPRSSADAEARVVRFWQSLGCRVVRMDADAHDHAVARVSHLPHLTASALMNVVGAETDLAAGGLADTTRVAAGDADLWTAIVQENAVAVTDCLSALGGELEAMRSEIAAADWDAVRARLDRAAKLRQTLDSRSPEDRHVGADR